MLNVLPDEGKSAMQVGRNSIPTRWTPLVSSQKQMYNKWKYLLDFVISRIPTQGGGRGVGGSLLKPCDFPYPVYDLTKNWNLF